MMQIKNIQSTEQLFSLAETWCDIPGYEGFYQVSHIGRVKSLDRTIIVDGKAKILKGRVMRLITTKKGYVVVSLCKNGVVSQFRVHILVGICFISNPENKPFVNHKRGNKKDNRAWMLEWCTSSENELHSYRVLGKKAPCPTLGMFNEKHHNSKPLLQISLDGTVIKLWPCSREVQRSLGLGHALIRACASGKKNTAYGYKWQFA